ncbi:MAG TPA: PAS domain S-box protein [Verrucomicrobiae bacterium]|jgi:PAS domain S-box-containing protein|nr:PAS domain S-box protein [Verrucomicrobiae bacterium]
MSEIKNCLPAAAGPESAEAREAELLWRNRQLTAFQRISEVMLADEEEQTIFDTIAREASEMTGFPMVAIELCDFERAVMVYRGVHGIDLDGLPKPFEVPMDVTLSGRVAHTGKALVETDAGRCRENAAPILRQLGIETFVCLPILPNGKVVGTLSLAHCEHVDVDPRMVKQAASLANYLATLFDRLHARDAVRRGEAELAAVYDRAPSVMCLFDGQLRIVRANRAAAEFTGRSKEELVSERMGKFLKCAACALDGSECGTTENCTHCELRKAVMDTFNTGKGWHRVRVKKSLLRKGGHWEEVVLLLSTERIQVDGMVRVLMCMEDITHSVRADEQIRSQAALLDVTQDAIFVRDFSDRILYWNDGAQRLYGWTTMEVRGKTSSELLAASSGVKQLSNALEAVREHGQWNGELRQKTREGRELTIQSRWTVVNERKGAPRAILVVNTDITEKKKLEAQLLRAQRLESIGTLASGLAHDLNNVLAPILMTVSFLKEEIEDETISGMINTLETCARRGAHIVRQVLMFARGVEGLRVLIQPKHLMEEMERIGRETFPRSLHIQTQICKQPWLITGDSTQLQQVLMNLWVNARDAMPQGGTLTARVENVTVGPEDVQSHPKAKLGAYVVISVTDTGTGIAPDLMDKIFDPFFTTKPIGQGTGLGLPTVLGIVESHGGFLHVDSEMGKGTVFKVYLPAVPAEKEREGLDTELTSLPRGNGEIVLVVDDEPAIRDIASRILTSHGYRPLTACEGNEALALFEQNRDRVKAIVSDLMMPRMDGPTTIRSMRKIKPDIKTIMITGLGEEGRVAEAKAAGSDLVLSKPFTAEQLLTALKQLLG